MFATDHQSNVGRLVSGAHANNPTWHKSYQSVLAFGPKKPGLPAAVFLDLDAPGAREALADYGSAVQDLRLLKGGGENVWKPGPKKWSEAAVALDDRGRVLFLFARSPTSMHAFNERLKALPLGITRAMHVEGGPRRACPCAPPM